MNCQDIGMIQGAVNFMVVDTINCAVSSCMLMQITANIYTGCVWCVHSYMVFVVDSVTQKQLACILGRQQVFFELADDYSELMDLMRNSSLNTHFINLAREVCL